MADVSDTIKKLVHPIVEIRTRALDSLVRKVELGLVTRAELASTHPPLVPHLLRLLHLGPPSTTQPLLTLLLFLAEDEGSRPMLAGQVVWQQLRELHAVAPVDLLPKVTLLLRKLGHTSNNCTTSTEKRVTGYEEAPDTSDSRPSHSPDPQCLGTDEYTEEGAGAESLCDWTGVQDASVTTAAGAGESALHFITFPWQALTKSDQHVLESSVRSLMSANVAEVRAALLFLDTVVVRDFPPEVLLQRPAVLQVVYGCLEEQGEDAWYLQGPACDLLHSLTKLLTARVHYFTNPHTQPGSSEVVSATSSGITSPSNLTRVSCCSPHAHTAPRHGPPDTVAGGGEPQPFSGVGQELLGSTIHEQDDGDEFILLGLHQVTVPGHCVRAMRTAASLLASHRPGLQSASLRLMTACITLLQDCVHPSMLWRVLVDGEPLEEEEEEDGEELLVTEVITGIQMVIGTLSDLILAGLEARKEAGSERWVMVSHCCSLFLCHILTTLVPVEAAAQVINNAVCHAVVMVLCDGGFFLQHPEQHHSLLQYLTEANPTSATEIKCLLFAARSLQATSSFLKASDSDLQGFLDLAERSLPSCSILQDAAILEKLLWGVGRQAKEGSASEEQLGRSRFMLLQCLHSPVPSVRLCGYKSVLGLVESSVGAAQTLDTSCSRSPAVLIFLSPDVIRFILFAGCADENKEVASIAQEALLTLLLGQPFMSTSVWTVAAKCWAACLPDLQCLADPSSSLGRAVDQTFEAVCDKDGPEALRYQLQCLFLLRREARSGPFFQACQKLKRMIPDLCFDSLRYSITVHNDLFILRQPIHIMRTCNLGSEEGGLLKVVELIHGGGTEAAVQKAAWTQLAFLLEDPNLHKAFMRLCSLPFLVQTFINSLKRGEGEGVSLECVPRVVECLRLLATHSVEVRLTLLQHPTFLIALMGATLLFYEDMRMRSQASCLMALVLFQDLISFSDTLEEIGATQLPSVPQFLAKGLHLPFLHRTHPWVEDRGLCMEMRTVHHLLRETEWPAREFLGTVWGAAQAGGVEWLSSHNFQDSKNSGCLLLLSERETAWLRLSILSQATTSALRNVENATSHHDVMKNVASLSFRVQQLALAGCCNKGFFTSAQWRGSFQRFLTSEPNSSVDEQLLVHILECLCTCLKVHSQGLRQDQNACLPIIKLLVTELTNPSSALLHTLSKAGGTSWVASDYSLQAVQTVRLFRAAAGLVSCTIALLAEGEADCEAFGENFWDRLATSVTTTLLPILSANNDLQHYNVAVVGMALEVLVHIPLSGWPGMELSSQLVTNSVRLISSFHLGRGLAHNSFVGRRVTLSSSLLLLHLFSHPNTDFSQVIQEASGEESLSWLVSLWVYRDPLVASCGLNVAAALATQTSLLHYNLTQVSGGVWAAALSYFLPEGRGCLVRASAALLLVQLTRVGPSPSSPWPSPVVADVCTGESVDGLEGLVTLLQHCNFYSLVLTSLSHLSVGPGPAGTSSPTGQEWDLSLSCLSSFGPGEREEEEEEEEGRQSHTSIQLYEVTLKLLVNLVLLGPNLVVPQLFSHGLVTVVITQLRSLVGHIESSQPHLRATEASLVLLRAVQRHQPAQSATIACNTGLEHLALGVLAAGLLPLVSLEVLAALLAEGGWGAVRVVEWVAACPSPILCPVVAAFHASAQGHLQAAAASFLIGLTQVVLHGREASQQDLHLALTGALDTPVTMPGNKALCPGWELCRHLIQLVCDAPQTPDSAVLGHLLLESLKLLLLISHSAREAAFHLRLSLLSLLVQPLQALQDKVTSVNLHISGNLLRCKDVKEEVLASIQSLEVATNWVVGGSGVEDVCETLLARLHPLWTPAQNTPSVMKALLDFLLSSTALHRCCVLLTRTSAMPGVPVSATRTRWPLLACVATLVCQHLARLTEETGSLSHCFKTLSRESLDKALSVVTNCARVPECVLVMNKLDVVGSVMRWLECRAALQEGVAITTRAVQLLAMLTIHQESRTALLKLKHWTATLKELAAHEAVRLHTLRVAASMALGRHSAASLLAQGSLVETLLEVLAQEEEGGEEELKCCEVALVTIWALAANNQRGKAILRQGPLRPLLRHLAETATDRRATFAQNVLHLLE